MCFKVRALKMEQEHETISLREGPDARTIFYRTDSAVLIEEYRSAYPPTQEHQKLDGKMRQT